MPGRKRRTLLPPDERRLQLLTAAAWVFAHKGYRAAGISDIIARAGVARGTFYLYFDSKERVFLAIVEDFHTRITLALRSVHDAPAPETADEARRILQAGFRQWLSFFAAHRDAATVILREASSIDSRFEKGFADLRHSFVEHFAGRYRRLQTLGFMRDALAPELVARLLLGMFDELLNSIVLRDPETNLDLLARQLADFQWNGIGQDSKGGV